MKKTILVLDDDPLAVEFARFELEEQGYQVIPCTTTKTALESFAREPIDAALIDLALPDISGQEAIRQCKNIQNKCAFLVISGHLTIEEFICLQDIGVADCFHKPVDFKIVIKVISKITGEINTLPSA